MESTLAEKRKRITDWVNDLDDKHLNQIIELSAQIEKPIYDPTYEATLTGKDKIEYWKKVGISGDELREDLHQYIKGLPWKKK